MTAVRRVAAAGAAAAAALLTAPATALADPGPPPVTVTEQPADVTVLAGNTASFSAAAGCDCTQQWQVSTDGGASYADVPGAASSPLTLTAAASDTGNRYRDVFTPSDPTQASPATTDAAVLTVNYGPQITEQPQDVRVRAGQEVRFAAAAVGRPAPDVHWQVSRDGGASWHPVPGTDSPTLEFPASADQRGWQFRAVFVNYPDSGAQDAVGDAVTTRAATLTVLRPGSGCFEEGEEGYCWAGGTAGGAGAGVRFTGLFTATFVEGSYGSVAVHATHGALITDQAGWPAGVHFTAGHGVATVSGTPAIGSAGTYRVVFTAHPGSAGTAPGSGAACDGCECDECGPGGDAARVVAAGRRPATARRVFVLTVVPARTVAAALPVTGSGPWADEVDVGAGLVMLGGILVAAGRRRRPVVIIRR